MAGSTSTGDGYTQMGPIPCFFLFEWCQQSMQKSVSIIGRLILATRCQSCSYKNDFPPFHAIALTHIQPRCIMRRNYPFAHFSSMCAHSSQNYLSMHRQPPKIHQRTYHALTNQRCAGHYRPPTNTYLRPHLNAGERRPEPLYQLLHVMVRLSTAQAQPCAAQTSNQPSSLRFSGGGRSPGSTRWS